MLAGLDPEDIATLLRDQDSKSSLQGTAVRDLMNRITAGKIRTEQKVAAADAIAREQQRFKDEFVNEQSLKKLDNRLRQSEMRLQQALREGDPIRIKTAEADVANINSQIATRAEQIAQANEEFGYKKQKDFTESQQRIGEAATEHNYRMEELAAKNKATKELAEITTGEKNTKVSLNMAKFIQNANKETVERMAIIFEDTDEPEVFEKKKMLAAQENARPGAGVYYEVTQEPIDNIWPISNTVGKFKALQIPAKLQQWSGDQLKAKATKLGVPLEQYLQAFE